MLIKIINFNSNKGKVMSIKKEYNTRNSIKAVFFGLLVSSLMTEVQARANSHSGIEEIIVYGSRSSGSSRPIHTSGQMGGSSGGNGTASSASGSSSVNAARLRRKERCMAKATYNFDKCVASAEFSYSNNIGLCRDISASSGITILGVRFGYDVVQNDGTCKATNSAIRNTNIALCQSSLSKEKYNCLY